MRAVSHVLAALTLTLGPLAGMGVAAAPALAAPPPATFTPGLPLLNGTGNTPGGAEPSIAVDHHGNVYVTGPVGVPTGGCPFWRVHPGTFNAQGLPYDYQGTIDTDHQSVGGGDCDVSTGPSTDAAHAPQYDDVSVSSLSLADLTTNSSTDGGATFRDPANPVGQEVPGVDRQWQDADYGLGSGLGVHYLTVHDLATTNIQVAVSTDGGYTFVNNSVAIDAAHQGTATGNNGNHFGTVVVNPTTHKLYIPFVAPSSPADSVNHVVYVAEGTPDTTNPLAPITWVDHTVYTGPANQTLDHIFPAIAVDGAGTVYVAWAGDTASSATNRIQLSRMTSPGNAAAWTAPVFVDTGASHSNMFPWLVAGAQPGLVDVAWYGGSLVGSGATCPGGQSGQPDDSAGVANNCFTQWTTKFAQSTDTGATFTVVDASDLVHKGSICDQGTACAASGGDRTLLDFFDVALDPAGAANIAYASDVSSPGTATIVYTRQCAGTSAATGAALTGDCGPLVPPVTPGPSSTCTGAHLVTDPAGDASSPVGGSTGTEPVDITDLSVADAGANVDVTLTLANLSMVPPPGTTDMYYYVTWAGPDGTQYGVGLTEPTALPSYRVGHFDPSSNQFVSGTTTAITGAYNAGPNGTIVWHVPKSLIANPVVPVAAGGTPALAHAYAVTVVGEGSADAGGLVFVVPADRAPNAGSAPAWSVCTGDGGPGPVVPEAPWAALLPLAAAGLLVATVAHRRRRAV